MVNLQPPLCFETTMEALAEDTIRVVAVIAEGCRRQSE